jgi:hypothetical protein
LQLTRGRNVLRVGVREAASFNIPGGRWSRSCRRRSRASEASRGGARLQGDPDTQTRDEKRNPGRVAHSGGAPGSLVVVTSPAYDVRGAAAPVAPWEGALATGLEATGWGAVEEVEGAVVATVPFTLFFCTLPIVCRAARVASRF